MKIVLKAGLTCAAADTGVALATSIMHSNTKLISMSETRTHSNSQYTARVHMHTQYETSLR